MPATRAFITGIGGFAGSHLAEELVAEEYCVAGSIYHEQDRENLASIQGKIQLSRLDVNDAPLLQSTLQSFKPDVLFHLAAIASVGQSFGNERLTMKVNTEGTLNVLDACRKVDSVKKVVFVGSADCYGIFRPRTKTLSEEQSLNPVSPYGISKASAEFWCGYYLRQHGVPVIIARSFNHSGPRQTEQFVIPSFARQIALIEQQRQAAVIKVGDLSARRDLSDVRDVVKGYRLLAEKGKVGEIYQFCSGKATAIRTVLQKLQKLSKERIRIETDQSKFRKNEIPVLRGSNKKAMQQLGWSCRYSLDETLGDTLNYWREVVGQGHQSEEK